MEMIKGIPRRIQQNLHHQSERMIADSIAEIEEMGCHPLLTDAVCLLAQAQEKVADFVELPDEVTK